MYPSTNAQNLTNGAPRLFDEASVTRSIELPQRFDVHAGVNLHVFGGDSGSILALDGSQVAFADMSSLQAMVDARLEALDHGWDIVVYQPSDELRATLELTGFDDLLPIVTGALV